MTMRARWLAILVVVGLGFTGLSTPWSGAWRGAWGGGAALRQIERPGTTVPVTSPGMPTNLAATVGEDDLVHLTWSAGSPAGSSYEIWRGFGGDKTLIGTSSSTTYVDEEPVYGSEAWYAVAAVNGGTTSDLSDEDNVRPLLVTDYGDAPYMAFWFQDPDYTWTRPSTSRANVLAKLAGFDLLITGPFIFEGSDSTGINDEPFYRSVIQDLRLRNPDMALVSYLHPWQLRTDAVNAADPMNPYRRQLEVASSYAGNAGFGRTVNGTVMEGRDYTGTRILNIMQPGMADTVASIFVDAIEHFGHFTGMADAINTGLFLDDMSINMQYYKYYTTADHSESGPYDEVQNILDLDRDGVVYKNDNDEKQAYWKYERDVLIALRREFGEHGMSQKLIIANTDIGKAKAGDERPYALETLALLDGTMFEGVNYWEPGCCAQDTTWERWFDRCEKVTNSQLEPPAAVFVDYTDSNSTYMGEVFALASGTWIDGGRTGHNAANQYVVEVPSPTLHAMQAPGAFVSRTYIQGTPDTLVATTANLVAKLALHPRSGTGLTDELWPYFIATADDDTLRRGGGWPRQAYSAPPPAAPVAAFAASTTSPCVDQTVNFTDQSTNTPTSWAWTFGDGGTSTANNPDHIYEAAGTYTVTLTATNGSGSDGETKTNYITVGECSVVITGTHSTDDIFDDGEQVVLDGTGFGTKSPVAPVQWDDFEEGTNGAVLTTSSGTPGWSEVSSGSGTTYYPHYSTAAAKNGSLGMYCRFDNSNWNSNVNIRNAARFSKGFYLDAWMRYLAPPENSRSWKPWIMYGTGSGDGWGFPDIDWFGGCSGSLTLAGRYWDSNGWSHGNLATVADFTGSMHHLQIWVIPESPRGATNGTVTVLLDGEDLYTTNRMFYGSGGTQTFERMGVGFYMSHDPNNEPGCVEPGDGYMYWDDVYLDDTRARIELGDASDYDFCTVREIQPPVTWSSTSVSFMARWGQLISADKAYVFVIDSQGYVSAGYQVYHN